MLNSKSPADNSSTIEPQKPIETTSAQLEQNPMLAAGLFVIEFKNGNNKFWLPDFNGGDPSRTLFIESAKKFKTSISAEKALKKTIAENPHRLLDGWIVPYTKNLK